MIELVSAEDYQCEAQAFPGIAKARATRLSSSHGDTVVISILNGGLSPDNENGPCGLLRAALTNAQDGGVRVLVLPGLLCPLVVAAKIKARAGASWDSTQTDIQTALIALFGFERREIGQTAYASQALAAIQAVKSVEFASLTFFCRFNPDPETWTYKESVDAFGGGPGDHGALKGGEMLLIQPHIAGSIALEQV